MRLGCPARSLQEAGALLHARGSILVVLLSWSQLSRGILGTGLLILEAVLGVWEEDAS